MLKEKDRNKNIWSATNNSSLHALTHRDENITTKELIFKSLMMPLLKVNAFGTFQDLHTLSLLYIEWPEMQLSEII